MQLGAEATATVLLITIETDIACAVARCWADGVEKPTPVGTWTFDSEDRVNRVREVIGEISRRLGETRGWIDDGLDLVSVTSIGRIDAENAVVLDIKRPGWPVRGYPLDLRREFRRSGGVLADFVGEHGRSGQVLLHNDATAAAYAEFKRGTGRDVRGNRDVSFVYIRVGEGVNAGLVVNLGVWRGGLHPELGHVLPRRHPADIESGFKGVCGVHGTCIEGLISTAALQDRWGVTSIGQLPPEEQGPARELIGFYIAQMCALVKLTLAPQRIALAGASVDAELCDVVARHYRSIIGAYPGTGGARTVRDYIRPAESGMRANVLGALELARAARFKGPRPMPNLTAE